MTMRKVRSVPVAGSSQLLDGPVVLHIAVDDALLEISYDATTDEFRAIFEVDALQPVDLDPPGLEMALRLYPEGWAFDDFSDVGGVPSPSCVGSFQVPARSSGKPAAEKALTVQVFMYAHATTAAQRQLLIEAQRVEDQVLINLDD